MQHDFDDILITPSSTTYLNSREEINIYYSNNYLPIMTAPMDTVVSYSNFNIFSENNILPVLPRYGGEYNEDFTVFLGEMAEDKFCAVSMNYADDILTYDKFKKILEEAIATNDENEIKILIDTANGHMHKLLKILYELKRDFGNYICLMAGNVATVNSYKNLADCGVDYVRCGIGNGGACLTTQNTAIGAGNASLIMECKNIKELNGLDCDIIADGGIKKYSDIIKALALGADYVMIGSLFNKCLESAGKTYIWGFEVDQHSNFIKKIYNSNLFTIKKNFRGMSTKAVQKQWGKNFLRASEGIEKKQIVDHTVKGWVDNLKDYLASTMSYCNARKLSEFKGNVDWDLISENVKKRFNK